MAQAYRRTETLLLDNRDKLKMVRLVFARTLLANLSGGGVALDREEDRFRSYSVGGHEEVPSFKRTCFIVPS